LKIEIYDLIIKSYEEGNLEDHYSGHRINPHGSPDCPWNHVMYGPRPDNVLDRLSHKKQEASTGLCLLIFIVRDEELLVPSELKCEA
jgi:hypothetical protein